MTTDKEKEVGEGSGTVKETLHQAYGVTKIHTKVRTLDGKNVTYSQWVKLFKLHVKAFRIYDHIDGTPPPPESDPGYKHWCEIDALVNQWIYATVSDDLFKRVLEDDDAPAYTIWTKLHEIFLNNKNARASALENEFTKHTLTSCGGLDEFCQKLKDIANQLADVGRLVTETRLVLQLIRGLPMELDTIGTILTRDLPSWDEARSQIYMEQERQAARSTSLSSDRNWFMFHSSIPGNDRNTPLNSQSNNDKQRTPYNSNYRGNNYNPNYRGMGRGQWRGGRSRGRGGGRYNQNNGNYGYGQNCGNYGTGHYGGQHQLWHQHNNYGP